MSDHSHGTRKNLRNKYFFSWLLLAKLQLFFNNAMILLCFLQLFFQND